MPVFLLIGIPIAVVVLFLGIMSLPDEDIKTEEITDRPVKKETKKKKKR